MIIGSTSERKYYRRKATATKKRVWMNLTLMYRMPRFMASKINYDELEAIVQFTHIYFLLPHGTLIINYEPCSINLSALYILVRCETYRQYNRIWAFKLPFDMQYLQNVLRYVNLPVYNKIFGCRQKFYQLEPPPLTITPKPIKSSIFPKLKNKSEAYYREQKSATQELMVNTFRLVNTKPNKVEKRLEIEFEQIANQISREKSTAEEQISSSNNSKLRITEYLQDIKAKIPQKHMNLFEQILKECSEIYTSLPQDYASYYLTIASEKGLPYIDNNAEEMLKITKRKDKKLIFSTFSAPYTTQVSKILIFRTNFKKIKAFAKLFDPMDIIKLINKEPAVYDSPISNIRAAMIVFIALTISLSNQSTNFCKRLLDIYRCGFMNCKHDFELTKACDLLSLISTTGIPYLRISERPKSLLTAVWSENIFKSALITKLHTALRKLAQGLKENKTDRISLYGAFACTIKGFVYLKTIYECFIHPLIINNLPQEKVSEVEMDTSEMKKPLVPDETITPLKVEQSRAGSKTQLQPQAFNKKLTQSRLSIGDVPPKATKKPATKGGFYSKTANEVIPILGYFEPFIDAFPNSDSQNINFEAIIECLYKLMEYYNIPAVYLDTLREYSNVNLIHLLIQFLNNRGDSSKFESTAQSISSAHKLIKKWRESVINALNPSEEVLFIICEYVPNKLMRKSVETNAVGNQLLLQHYVTVAACCEALLLRGFAGNAALKAIQVFLMESNDNQFYTSVLSNLSFLLEGIAFKLESTLENIYEYFTTINESTLNISFADVTQYVKKRNYVFLLPHNIYNTLQPDVKKSVSELLVKRKSPPKVVQESAQSPNVPGAPSRTNKGNEKSSKAPVEPSATPKMTTSGVVAGDEGTIYRIKDIREMDPRVFESIKEELFLVNCGIPMEFIDNFNQLKPHDELVAPAPHQQIKI